MEQFHKTIDNLLAIVTVESWQIPLIASILVLMAAALYGFSSTMMKSFLNYLRKRRLFRDKKSLNRFINENMRNKVAGFVLEVSIIKHYINLGEYQEVRNRSKGLRLSGLNPPKTLKQCDKMMNDLKRWYL